MAKYINNISNVDKEYLGITIPAESLYEIPSHLYLEFAHCAELISDIQQELVKVSRDGVNDIVNKTTALALIQMTKLRSSLAVDKNGINQQVSGTNAVKITADRVLWDLHEDYDVSEDCIQIPYDGVYSFDCQIKLTNITNCSFVELAIYKKLENGVDYWFILDRKAVGTATELQMNGATQFDFYQDEEYELRIILTKSLPLLDCSCTISGDDDYTAWGLNLSDLF